MFRMNDTEITLHVLYERQETQCVKYMLIIYNWRAWSSHVAAMKRNYEWIRVR